MKAKFGTNWDRTATARGGGAYPRGQMEMFGPPPVPDVVYPQRMGWMYGDPAFDNTLGAPQSRTVGGLMSDMYRASGNAGQHSQPYSAADRLPTVLGGRDMGMGPGSLPTGSGGGALVPQGGALATQGAGMPLNRPALPGGPIDMGMVERVYPVPATTPLTRRIGSGALRAAGAIGGALTGPVGATIGAVVPAMIDMADSPMFNGIGGVTNPMDTGFDAMAGAGMPPDLGRQGRGRSQGADGPQTQGYSAGPVNSRGQGFVDPRLIRAPAQAARPAPRPVARPAPAPVSYDNGGVRAGPNAGINDETRMAAMRALGILP